MAKKILIIDDDPVVLNFLKAFLLSRDYEVLTSADGLDGLNLIKQHTPDLVLLDVMLPEVNGYDICYQLRFNDEFAKIPIILMTARDQELGVLVGEKTNIEYVPKPINSQELLGKIELLLPPTPDPT